MRIPLKTVIAIFYCATLGTYLCAIIIDADFYFHLTVGNWIRSHGALPTSDLWTAAGAGQPWISTSWLFQLLLSAVETTWGWDGIAITKLLLSSATALTLFFLFHALARDTFFAGLVVTLAACGVLERAPLGPELVAWPLITGIFIAALRGNFLALFFLSALLTNIHSGLSMAALAACLIVWPRSYKNHISMAGGLFCSPYLGRHLLYAVRELGVLAENGFKTGSYVVNIYHYAFCFLLLAWIVLLFLSVKRQMSRASRRLFQLTAILSGLGFVFEPLLPLALIFCGMTLGSVWGEGKDERPITNAITRLGRGLGRLPATGVIWVFFCLIVVNSVNFYILPELQLLLPVHETDYLLEHKLPEPFWNASDAGAYLIYRFSGPDGTPKRPVPLDSRSLVFHAVAEPNLETAGTLLVREKSALAKQLGADSRFERIPIPDPASDSGEETRKLPRFWALYQRRVEPKPVL